MNAQTLWQAFAQTGDVRHYLAYRQQTVSEAAAQKGTVDGCDRNPRAGASGSEIPRSG